MSDKVGFLTIRFQISYHPHHCQQQHHHHHHQQHLSYKAGFRSIRCLRIQNLPPAKTPTHDLPGVPTLNKFSNSESKPPCSTFLNTLQNCFKFTSNKSTVPGTSLASTKKLFDSSNYQMHSQSFYPHHYFHHHHHRHYRHKHHHLFHQIYIPCCLFVMVSWISFIIDPKVSITYFYLLYKIPQAAQ